MSTVTVVQETHSNPPLPLRLPPRVPSPELDDVESSSPVQQAGSTVDDALPRPGQRVFDVAPANILSNRRRFAVSVLIVLSNLIQMISYGGGVVGGLKISQVYGVQGVHATWVAASYPLTQGTFVLVSGRLGAVFGHKNMLFLGGSLFTVFTLINGFVPNYIAFNAIRALSGIGGALILPNAVAMIAITNPPGRWRNLSLGFFGASAPIGGCVGGMYIGLLIEYSNIKWYFVAIAAVAAAIFVSLWALGPKEVPVDRHGKIDYIGAILGTSALIIFSYVWNQAPAVGWTQPLEYTLLLVSVVLFGLFIAWEARTPHPIMPLAIYKAPSFGPLLLVVLLNYMAMGTILWYMLLWQQNIRHWSVLHTAIGWSPFLVIATLGSLLAAWLVPRLAAQWIVAIGTVTAAISSLLLATMPRQQIYWAQMFPATVFMALCPDLTFTAAQIIASNAVRRREQGVAGSLIGTLNLYGNSLGLGFAATVESRVVKDHGNTVLGYRSALFFGLGISLLALLIDIFFVRLVKDEREGWEHADDEDGDGAEIIGRPTEPDRTSGVELRRVAQASLQNG